jgi:hypothetical protein
VSVAIDFAPSLLVPLSFDVAWVEQITPDGGGSPYQAIFYEKLECVEH